MPKSSEPPASFSGVAGAEIPGDKILVSARKFNRSELVRLSGQHHATEVVVEKDARAKILRSYTNLKRD